MKITPRFLILLFWIVNVFLLSACNQNQPTHMTALNVLFKDQAARGLLKAEKFEDALELYIQMLEDEPGQARIHSNIGVILSQTQKPEEALKSLEHGLQIAKEKDDFEAQFAIHFNLGVYFGAQKKITEALQHYQAALDLNPTSKETKTNIELLIQSQNQKGQNGDQKNKQDQSQSQSQDQKNKQDQNQQNQKDQQKNQPSQDQGDQKKDQPQNQKDQEKDQQGQRQSSAKYKPRPFQGEQLSEGDVKKILGELRNQEQKIRAHFDKKEKKESGNEKDW